MSKETDEVILGVMRGLGAELVEKLKEIDSDLLVRVASGDPKNVNYSRTYQIESTAPASVLATQENWNQIAWHNMWPDTHGWTDVWGQRPPPQ